MDYHDDIKWKGEHHDLIESFSVNYLLWVILQIFCFVKIAWNTDSLLKMELKNVNEVKKS